MVNVYHEKLHPSLLGQMHIFKCYKCKEVLMQIYLIQLAPNKTVVSVGT